jgi:hypothetical protein
MTQTSLTHNVAPAAASAAALVAGLAAIDTDIRGYVTGFFSGQAPSDLSSIDSYVRGTAHAVVLSLKDQSIGHGPLITLVIAGGVLLFFMLRT